MTKTAMPHEAACDVQDQLAWLALTLTPGLGPRRILEAVKQLETPSQIFELSLTELEALRLSAEAAQFLFDGKGRRAAEAEWAALEALGAQLLAYNSPRYPERLREIYDPPPVLWLRGEASLLARPAIAIVGTRHPSPYGSGVAEMLARDLAARRLLIVSGMARGIDTCAHKGSLAARMPTVAVWGTGLDVVYPKENKKLSEDILATGGAILSEVPLGTFPAPQNFPRRNRIISGVSIAVLVVEAAENSGTRVTARCAAEQNRDLFAVPGNVTNKNSWTPNTLIKQGAKLVATWEDVWEDLPSNVRIELEAEAGLASKPGAQASLLADQVLRPEEAMVLEVLRADESLQIDEVLELLESQLTSSEVLPLFLSWRWQAAYASCRARITCGRCRAVPSKRTGNCRGSCRFRALPADLRVQSWRAAGEKLIAKSGKEPAFRDSFQVSRPIECE